MLFDHLLSSVEVMIKKKFDLVNDFFVRQAVGLSPTSWQPVIFTKGFCDARVLGSSPTVREGAKGRWTPSLTFGLLPRPSKR